jgi:hypothetical protein
VNFGREYYSDRTWAGLGCLQLGNVSIRLSTMVVCRFEGSVHANGRFIGRASAFRPTAPSGSCTKQSALSRRACARSHFNQYTWYFLSRPLLPP